MAKGPASLGHHGVAARYPGIQFVRAMLAHHHLEHMHSVVPDPDAGNLENLEVALVTSRESCGLSRWKRRAQVHQRAATNGTKLCFVFFSLPKLKRGVLCVIYTPSITNTHHTQNTPFPFSFFLLIFFFFVFTGFYFFFTGALLHVGSILHFHY